MAMQQGHDGPSRPSQKQRKRTRPLIAVVALIVIIGGAVFWLVEMLGSLYVVLPIIILSTAGKSVACG